MPKLRWMFLAILISTCPSVSAQTYDIIIRGGHVIDGAGNPWIKADVGIRAGHIVRIGRLDGAQAARVIDAAGQVATPGFIDTHAHSEYVLLYDGNAQSKIRQGVTTEVFGEATSPGPIEGPGVEPNQQLLKPLRIELTWNDLNGYFQRLMKTRSSVNVASYVSACQVRYVVVGFENRPPTSDEMEKMRQLVASSMEQGAVGLSDALEATCGYAKTDELIEEAKVVAKYGGIYGTHLRGEGDTVLDSIREAIEIGEKANVPVEIFHIKVAGSNNWGACRSSSRSSIPLAPAAWTSMPINILTSRQIIPRFLYCLRGPSKAASTKPWSACWIRSFACASGMTSKTGCPTGTQITCGNPAGGEGS